MRNKMDRLTLLAIPEIVRIKSPQQDRHIRIDTLDDLIKILTVIRKILPFKYFFIFAVFIFISRQQKNSVPFFSKLENDIIHQAASAAYQQNIHTFPLFQLVVNQRFAFRFRLFLFTLKCRPLRKSLRKCCIDLRFRLFKINAVIAVIDTGNFSCVLSDHSEQLFIVL